MAHGDERVTYTASEIAELDRAFERRMATGKGGEKFPLPPGIAGVGPVKNSQLGTGRFVKAISLVFNLKPDGLLLIENVVSKTDLEEEALRDVYPLHVEFNREYPPEEADGGFSLPKPAMDIIGLLLRALISSEGCGGDLP